jgi:type IV pilus assembly protein PilE
MRLRKLSVSGFTLIEVLVVVTILGILVAVGIPAYTDYMMRGRREEGRAALLASLGQMERYFAANNTYVTFANATQASTAGFASASGDDPARGYYDLSAAACGGATAAQCVVISAVPRAADAGCGTLTISTSGTRGSSVGGAATRCWQR